jgi:hypothetical protein
MYKIIKNGDNTSASVVQLVADQDSDVDLLPKNVGVGSTCVVIGSSSVYMMGNDKEWHKL